MNRRNRLSSRSPLNRQRGASMILTGISLVALVSALVSALDVGNMYSAQRQLQRQTNMAALDASRVVSGCAGPTDDILAHARQVAQTAITRNYGSEAVLGNGALQIGNVVID